MRRRTADATDAGRRTRSTGVETERVGDYDHLLGDLAYDDPAPSGGDHPPAPYWLTCGVYDGEVPAELAVHSLEHGAVWIALGPDSTADDRAAAAELAEGRKVIVSDVPDLADPVELVAWGFRLTLESADDPRADRVRRRLRRRADGARGRVVLRRSRGRLPPSPARTLPTMLTLAALGLRDPAPDV